MIYYSCGFSRNYGLFIVKIIPFLQTILRNRCAFLFLSWSERFILKSPAISNNLFHFKEYVFQKKTKWFYLTVRCSIERIKVFLFFFFQRISIVKDLMWLLLLLRSGFTVKSSLNAYWQTAYNQEEGTLSRCLYFF